MPAESEVALQDCRPIFQRSLSEGNNRQHPCVVQSAAIDEEVARWRRQAVRELQRVAESSRQHRHSSFASETSLRSLSAQVIDPSSSLPTPTQAALPARATSWTRWPTVALEDEENSHTQATEQQQVRGCMAHFWWLAQGWILAIGVGICSSLSGAAIDFGVQVFSSYRFGRCDRPLVPFRHCPEGEWTYWGTGLLGLTMNVGLGTVMAFVSGLLVYSFAPAAAGSGIPEVKTILNGFVMPDVVSLRTLAVKCPGLMLSVASGMALGKEGPLVHVAVCWAQTLSGFFPQFQNEGKRRELFSAAAAAGVSTAFGAPLGGVLFSLEEVSSFFPSKTLLRAFTAAISAAVVLSVINTTNTKGLTLFSVEYNTACHPVEYLVFACIGVIGGLTGALFNAVNVHWSSLRMKPSFRKHVHPLTEVTCIALITLVTSYPLGLTRELSSDSIHAMFEACDKGSGKQLRGHLGLCTSDDQYAPISQALLFELAMAAVVRLMQTILTFGSPCPAGLFVPSLFTGASIGRLVGTVMQAANQDHRFFARDVEPGVYSMVGAAAVLGGVCRVTISLVAIMLELTGGMTYIVPFMIAILIAKLVGDCVNEGIYDLYIVLKGYPFLQEELEITFTERCCDIMETGLTKLDLSLMPSIADLHWLLQNFTFRGFPVVSEERFIGYTKRQHLQNLLRHLEGLGRDNDAAVREEELLPVIDCNVMRMMPDAPLTQAHRVFKQLGCKYIFLVGSRGRGTQDELQGILSKKNFLRFLKAGKVGHMVDYPNSAPSLEPGHGAGAAASDRHLGSLLARSIFSRRTSSNPLAQALRQPPSPGSFDGSVGDDDDRQSIDAEAGSGGSPPVMFITDNTEIGSSPNRGAASRS
eukprot:TRINITY_DN90618_c0_g1_i1.p1 TRINITY_DN90618_c0_g1~~TRINITY_DN90618_c0_g1_i1.p1  ORF type:complete len:878 (-),score=147.54 TRINITY_DN90618_c0_g1_i1:67-2664(-)